MKTTLAPERLAELGAEGARRARASKFVDPHAAYLARRVIAERGREWVNSVLMRDAWVRRSRLHPSMPWLEDGELEALVLAGDAELALLAGTGE